MRRTAAARAHTNPRVPPPTPLTYLVCRRLPAILGRMTAVRDDDFMALPGMEADSTAHDTARHRSDDTAPASSKSALDALLDEYRARAKSEREKGTLFGCLIVVDTSGAPWSNGFVKVSHPRVRAESPRRTYGHGVPSCPPATTRLYCRYQAHTSRSRNVQQTDTHPTLCSTTNNNQ